MIYTVGELSKATGIPASTIRYYDSQGLLPQVERSSGGMRVFDERSHQALQVLECLKESGLSIKEMKEFIELVEEGDDSLGRRLELFRSRRDAMREQMKKMESFMQILDFKVWYYETALQAGTESKMASLSDEDVPAELRQAWKRLNH